MEYRIKREKPDDELFHSDEYLGEEFDDGLHHWKYIKREKVNGKWRYYYDDSKLRDFTKGTTKTSKTTDEYDRTITNTTQYKQTNDLFDKKTTITSGGTVLPTNTTVINEQGKLSRIEADAEKWIFDTFIDPRKQAKVKRNVDGAINKGKSFVKKLFGIN